jgi:hypothetical protein
VVDEDPVPVEVEKSCLTPEIALIDRARLNLETFLGEGFDDAVDVIDLEMNAR